MERVYYVRKRQVLEIVQCEILTESGNSIELEVLRQCTLLGND